ncbi:MAG TPA: hypothetical protein VE029_03660 [Rhizobacter sp.]|nr:hypothetical protein [Rhizobacter sp.]
MIGHATLARPRRFCASANWRDPGSIAQAGAAKAPRHVLVTFTDEAVRSDTALNGAALSEPALAQDWLRDEEEAAWAHLQLGK